MKLKILFFALLVACASCVKENNAPTVFDIHCDDNYGYSAPGVAVTVYGNYSDWLNQANPLYSETTDFNGNVSFSGLNPQVYYFNCTDVNNCLTNWDVYQSNGPMESHATNTLNLALTAYGTLKVVNTSAGSNPYQIKVDGQVWINDLEYNNYAKEILPVGNHFLENYQLNGSNYTSYPVQILQCQTTVQDVP